MITLPAALFGLITALLAGALFHVLRGGGGSRLILYFGLSVIGFILGQVVGAAFGWQIYTFGALDLGAGLIGSIVILLLGDWLSRLEPNDKSSV